MKTYILYFYDNESCIGTKIVRAHNYNEAYDMRYYYAELFTDASFVSCMEMFDVGTW